MPTAACLRGIEATLLTCSFAFSNAAVAMGIAASSSRASWQVERSVTDIPSCVLENGEISLRGSPKKGFVFGGFTYNGSTSNSSASKRMGGSLSFSNPAITKSQRHSMILVRRIFVRRLSPLGPVVIDDPVFRREYRWFGSRRWDDGEGVLPFMLRNRQVTFMEERDGAILLTTTVMDGLPEAENFCERLLSLGKGEESTQPPGT